MRIHAIALLICCTLNTALSQEAVYFYTLDSLKVRGDLYLHNLPNRQAGNQLPFIILCHQDGSNRSEYYDIAPRLLNLNYNCLAIDLRAGGKLGYTENETARRALAENRATGLFDAREDIVAAISYIRTFNRQPVILFGSSFSASLCLITAMNNPDVKAVIAFSPGEYFQPRMNISREIVKMDKLVFVSASQSEYDYLKKMLAGVPPGQFTLFKPEKSKGVHGVKALDISNAAHDEYWFALMMFFKKLV